MAMRQNDCEREQQQQSSSLLLDALYCEEERWEEEDDETSSIQTLSNRNPCLFSLPLLEQDMFWEDEELLSLFSKEQEQQKQNNVITDPSLFLARQEAVEWIVKVNARYGFSVLTAVLAIDYLDRFLCNPCFQKEKPWMVQLVSVTCLSLAAKVEETEVPLLLDFQGVETKYVFEPKTIQRMELLVLSTLKWKMHPVTPLSFVDHIMRRLGLKNHVQWEFHRRCESLLLSVVSDSRFMGFVPSVMATATMMHIIDQVEPFNPIEYKNQLLGVLDSTNKEKVNECYGLIVEQTKIQHTKSKKRKLLSEPISPSGVIDGAFSSECESSNDSWSVGSSSVSVSVSEPPPLKKSKTQDQKMGLFSLNRVFVEIVGSPRPG
ncbi:cyclin-D3-1-like [Tripterygium wilfordii]|uniref:B-like cyclin n=1 Tax=Tripterygium wilfordii TaxID=458696 RepID=A0A7J7C0G7_TRIWF|nr:cyclin-D3-1-like [Tripterygium wilfordii]KAF5727266.1 cyclin-D3-1-like [Tripterygium wilfordii]